MNNNNERQNRSYGGDNRSPLTNSPSSQRHQKSGNQRLGRKKISQPDEWIISKKKKDKKKSYGAKPSHNQGNNSGGLMGKLVPKLDNIFGTDFR